MLELTTCGLVFDCASNEPRLASVHLTLHIESFGQCPYGIEEIFIRVAIVLPIVFRYVAQNLVA